MQAKESGVLPPPRIGILESPARPASRTTQMAASTCIRDPADPSYAFLDLDRVCRVEVGAAATFPFKACSSREKMISRRSGPYTSFRVLAGGLSSDEDGTKNLTKLCVPRTNTCVRTRRASSSADSRRRRKRCRGTLTKSGLQSSMSQDSQVPTAVRVSPLAVRL